MNEDDQSLADQAAAWVPPWQRPHVVPSADAQTPTETDESWVASVAMTTEPSQDSNGRQLEAEPDEGESDDWQQPETDSLVRGGQSTAGGFAAAGGGDEPDRDEDESDDWQQPETDVRAVGGGEEPDRDEDESDGWQQPETDVVGDPGPVRLEATPAEGDDTADSDRPANLSAALEAILLVVDEPVTADVLAEVLDVGVDEATEALEGLSAEYTRSERGFDLRRAAGGWRLYTRGQYASYVERFVLDGQSVRLTQAALETLAVIAYQQPVTRSRMSAIRGVNCDGVVRTLSNRGLIEECGASPDSGAFLYRTTPLFLEKLGLDSLDELPPLAPFLPDDVNGFIDA